MPVSAKWPVLVGLALCLAATPGCQPAPSKDVQAQLNQLDSVSAQRDSLISEVAQNARLMNELNAELSKVEGLKEKDASTAESPLAASRDNLVDKVQQITARLTESEKRLAQSRRQLKAMGRSSDSLKSRVTALESQVADFQAMIESQKTTVASMTERIQVLEAANVALHDTVGTMQDTITTLQNRESTAYYVVGTEKELLDRGIIVKEGGHRVLFIFGKAGQTLAPARELNPAEFTAIDTRTTTTIPLPDSTADYKIASRQDLQYLADSLVDRDKVRGAIRIGEPSAFWQASKFLIVVRS